MSINPISVALKGKGPFKFVQRVGGIVQRYGLTPAKMVRAFETLTDTLAQFECSGTFPIATMTFNRNPDMARAFQAAGIEFAVHGLRHVDHTMLSSTAQSAQLTQACRLFAQAGVTAHGFRAPYLRWDDSLIKVLQSLDFLYDASLGLVWDVLPGPAPEPYRHVLHFYGARSATKYPSVPHLVGELVRIPYSLPDDEALVERLGLQSAAEMTALWLAVLEKSYQLGELFAMGLHPERAPLCRGSLAAVLRQARRANPPVWIARLDEIARWWRQLAQTRVRITETQPGRLQFTVDGPAEATLLARNVRLQTETTPWFGAYAQIRATTFTVKSAIRPVIGVSSAGDALAHFLRQQGYLVEVTDQPQHYAFFFDKPAFTPEDERPVLADLEQSNRPLIRLNRWPGRARSALAVTGDIDALTFWDYGLRLIGR